jgi:hypothetical protein
MKCEKCAKSSIYFTTDYVKARRGGVFVDRHWCEAHLPKDAEKLEGTDPMWESGRKGRSELSRPSFKQRIIERIARQE